MSPTLAIRPLPFDPSFEHGLAAHRPIGGVNRSRKPVYELSAQFRGTHNGCPMHEPRAAQQSGL